MLRISKKADYAVFLLGCFAREGAFPGGSAATSVVSAHEVARLAGLNKSVVANLLKIFAKEGMLESVRGLNGGYRLTREPLQVTLGQILTAIDGPFQLVECVRDSHSLGSSKAGSSKASSSLAGSSKAGSSLAGSSLAGSSLKSSSLKSSSLKSSQGHQCSLISFCPSKNPMRIVHDRIERILNELTLSEMCGLTACPTTPLFALNTHR
jgi:Rrf2 family protein